jgi:hypothetical protein
MRYQFEGKFHRTDRHTLEQRKEMCLLINAGVPYKVIENAYDVNPHTLRVVSGMRRQWMDKDQLARSDEAKFAYAQRLYCETPSAEIRKIIDDAVIKPFARDVAARLLTFEPRELLLEEILCVNPRADKEHAKHVYSIVYTLMLHDINAQRSYRDEENAVWELTLPVREQLVAHETRQLHAWRIMRDTQLDKFLAKLTETEQDVIRQQYGIGNKPRSLAAIAESYGGRPKQWAHKIKRDALQHIMPAVKDLYTTLCLP